MIETLLLALLVSLWMLLRQKNDWYVVELRTCSGTCSAGDNTTFIAFPPWPEYGFNKKILHDSDLSVGNGLSSPFVSYSIVLTNNSGVGFGITQTIFQDIKAALLYFEREQESMRDGSELGKIYLWRIVATSRKKAIVRPPESYEEKEGLILLTFPSEHYFDPAEEKKP